ncbi:MAG: signal transduction histidine kinase, nitrogen specific, NtrB, partial [Holophagaceae bacterium]|nr:signal transduction histidine kinase, nitrogen specific, NtrB [Holophagaceae bacterium]
KDGTYLRYESRATVFLDPRGGQSITVISRCIEGERRTQEELHQTKALQGLLLDNNAIGIALVIHHIFEWVSPRLAEMLGMPQDQLQGAPASLVGSSLGTQEEFWRLVRPTLAKGEWFDQEAEFFRSDGTLFWGRLLGKALHPEDPESGSVWILEDITARHHAEVALRQSLKLESLGILAGGIAHDFNNLLAAILGNLNLAQNKLPENATAQDYLSRVERTVIRASDLTRQMLAYSGRGQFVVRPHNLNTVVEEVTHLLQASLSKKIRLRFKLAQELPPFLADAAQIQQVVMNLVTNAADAIGEGEGVITLSTEQFHLTQTFLSTTFPANTLKPGPYLILSVEDTGCGMSREIMDRIFDPFFTTKLTGRGLGLSAMLGILRGHNADIKIYSEEGKGSVFKVFFPANPPEPLPSPEPEEPALELFSGKVLLVDDEMVILEITRTALGAMGFEVVTAEDGLEALETFRKTPYEFTLVMMDLTMPRMDGREAMDAMLRIRPNLPIVLTSGYCDLAAIQEPLGHGLASFIQKPYQIKDLQRTIRNCLQRH